MAKWQISYLLLVALLLFIDQCTSETEHGLGQPKPDSLPTNQPEEGLQDDSELGKYPSLHLPKTATHSAGSPEKKPLPLKTADLAKSVSDAGDSFVNGQHLERFPLGQTELNTVALEGLKKTAEGNSEQLHSENVAPVQSAGLADGLDHESKVTDQKQVTSSIPSTMSKEALLALSEKIPHNLSAEQMEQWRQNISQTLGLSPFGPGKAMLPLGNGAKPAAPDNDDQDSNHIHAEYQPKKQDVKQNGSEGNPPFQQQTDHTEEQGGLDSKAAFQPKADPSDQGLHAQAGMKGQGHQPQNEQMNQGHQPLDSQSNQGHQPLDSQSNQGHQPLDSQSNQGRQLHGGFYDQEHQPLNGQSHQGHQPQGDLTGQEHQPQGDLNDQGHQAQAGLNDQGHQAQAGLNDQGHQPQGDLTGQGHQAQAGLNDQGHQPQGDLNGQGHQPQAGLNDRGHQPLDGQRMQGLQSQAGLNGQGHQAQDGQNNQGFQLQTNWNDQGLQPQAGQNDQGIQQTAYRTPQPVNDLHDDPSDQTPSLQNDVNGLPNRVRQAESDLSDQSYKVPQPQSLSSQPAYHAAHSLSGQNMQTTYQIPQHKNDPLLPLENQTPQPQMKNGLGVSNQLPQNDKNALQQSQMKHFDDILLHGSSNLSSSKDTWVNPAEDAFEPFSDNDIDDQDDNEENNDEADGEEDDNGDTDGNDEENNGGTGGEEDDNDDGDDDENYEYNSNETIGNNEKELGTEQEKNDKKDENEYPRLERVDFDKLDDDEDATKDLNKYATTDIKQDGKAQMPQETGLVNGNNHDYGHDDDDDEYYYENKGDDAKGEEPDYKDEEDIEENIEAPSQLTAPAMSDTEEQSKGTETTWTEEERRGEEIVDGNIQNVAPSTNEKSKDDDYVFQDAVFPWEAGQGGVSFDDDNDWYYQPDQGKTPLDSKKVTIFLGTTLMPSEATYQAKEDKDKETIAQIGAPEFQEGVISVDEARSRKPLQAPKGTIVLYTVLIVIFIAGIVVFSIWKNPFKIMKPSHSAPIVRTGEEGKRLLDHPFV